MNHLLSLYLTAAVTFARITAYSNDVLVNRIREVYEEENVAATDIVGHAYYLPKTNVLSTLTGGNKVFDDTKVKGCISNTPIRQSQNKLHYYKDKQALYQAVSNEAGLKAALKGGSYTIRASLDTIYSTSSWRKTEVKSSSLDYGGYESVTSIDLACALSKSKVTHQFLQDLSTLAARISNPSSENGWTDYEWFMNKYGSHFVSKVYSGARLQHFATTQSSSSYDESDFMARLCLDVEGMTPGKKVSVNGCNRFSKQRREEAESYEMRRSTYIRGGDPKIRSQLLIKLDPTKIEQFINSASSFPNPIAYGFTPIWQLLLSLSGPGDDIHYKALNMHAYYSGLKEFGCTERKSPSGHFILQQFIESSVRGSFQCLFAYEGCHSGDDCHIGGWGSVCYCYGDSCVAYDKYGRPQTQRDQRGSYSEGINNSCHYRVGIYCACESWGATKVAWNSAPGSMLLKQQSLLVEGK